MSMQPVLVFTENAGLALVFGAIIGVERQIRNSVAGLRTNTLVALGAAMFVMSETLMGNRDARVAAQVVSGIGFIGGGAILREGLTIRGVNTAATLWCSAAVGVLCGSGFVAEAAAATGLILIANVALRPVSYKFGAGTKLRNDLETHYALQFTCRAVDESRLRQLVAVTAKNSDLLLQSVHSEELPMSRSCVKAIVISATKADHLLERVVEILTADPSVSAIEWQVVAQHEQHE